MKNLTYIPYDLPGKLFRSPMPFAAFDFQNTTLEEYLQAKVSTVVMLTEPEEDVKHAKRDLKKVYAENEIDVLQFPIVDFDTPEDHAALSTILNRVIDKINQGENIAVHCFAGRGRTGMFIGLLTRKILGLEGEEAIKWVRKYFPAIETTAQEKFVIEYKLIEN